MQALFSKNFEDVEKIELSAMPISCRIDFQDHVISQEILALVKEWNKGLNKPQGNLPYLEWFKKHGNFLAAVIRNIIPIFTASAVYAFYWNISNEWTSSEALTIGILEHTVHWVVVSVAILFLSTKIAGYIAKKVMNELSNFGRSHAMNITKGDFNRQNKLMARNSRSFWRFIMGGVITILWSSIAGIITAKLLGN